ncbi:hypothetical protein NliqN6_5732 [Naganishia liquefaciens]|uniref:Uncharacterized protein n=1 Tax=Naganishia liquefaciens TaxID=104408 RepID=A0A8H3TY33_9TREE|nr:hypothetical protein NliqN6_5732 [Naganishia liquefaciens]
MASTLVKHSASLFAQIAPYLPHPLQTAPQAIALHFRNPKNNVPWYQSYAYFYRTASDPIHTVLPLLGTVIIATYVMSVLTRNVSQVDRMWTTFPVIYSLHFALFPLLNEHGSAFVHNLPRVLWCVRLTYHTARRGLYSFNEEDYRYTQWRKMVPAWFFQLFSFFFVSGAQSILLLAMALPLHNALVTPANEHKASLLALPLGLHLSDIALACLSVLTIYLQWISDNQQYSYQTYKHALKASPPDNQAIQKHKVWQHGSSRIEWTPRDIKRGFLTRGLFRWSRHPNFACEQVMWLLQSLFPLLSGRPSELTKARWMVLMNPLYTALAMSMLFVSSTWFTESLSSAKYPEYRDYQTLVGEFAVQSTIWKGVWARLTGLRPRLVEVVWGQGLEDKAMSRKPTSKAVGQ